ncbi:hypothetical protein GGS24DRAFT_29913 [Hypoxylon argillaceum]|nr:hypothetical protein GGS24DRAFT_29913 [Hypoxylon argillaceum]KAI1156324.1 hypothetical protein F4825DRAFT_403606 [Nemania diffusa]
MAMCKIIPPFVTLVPAASRLFIWAIYLFTTIRHRQTGEPAPLVLSNSTPTHTAIHSESIFDLIRVLGRLNSLEEGVLARELDYHLTT